jgi:hypothetical protein
VGSRGEFKRREGFEGVVRGKGVGEEGEGGDEGVTH